MLVSRQRTSTAAGLLFSMMFPAMDSNSTQVAVIGAGPNGLSVAAHLRHRGLAVRAFGPPMSFWLRMPATINLKSFAWATNVAAPRPHFTYQEYCRANGLEDVEPCSMAS